MRTELWFWAWTVETAVRKDNLESIGEIWENLIIVNASSAEEAYEKAEVFGKRSEGDSDGSLTLDGRPATKLFLGVSDLGVIHEDFEDGAEILFRSRRGYKRNAVARFRPKSEAISRLEEEVRRVLKYGNDSGAPAIHRS